MGWKIYRVWSTEWFRNPDTSRKMLIENVNRAVNKTLFKDDAVDCSGPRIEVDSIEGSLSLLQLNRKKGGTPYAKATKRFNRDVVIKPCNTYLFEDLINSIVSDEGPIHIDLLMERVKDLTGIDRFGNNVEHNFNQALGIAVHNKYIEKNKEDKGFLFKVGETYKGFRTEGGGVQRRLSQISIVEIKNALVYLIQEQFGLAYDNLAQSIKPLFGITRIDPEESDRLKDIVDDMISAGEIVKHGPLINLASK
jgi:hypothetical protein